jgi:hypothetical protein
MEFEFPPRSAPARPVTDRLGPIPLVAGLRDYERLWLSLDVLAALIVRREHA